MCADSTGEAAMVHRHITELLDRVRFRVVQEGDLRARIETGLRHVTHRDRAAASIASDGGLGLNGVEGGGGGGLLGPDGMTGASLRPKNVGQDKSWNHGSRGKRVNRRRGAESFV